MCACSLSCQVAHAGSRGNRLEDPRFSPGRIRHGLSEFTSGSTRSVEEVAIKHDAATDSRSNPGSQHPTGTLAGSMSVLTPGSGVHVILKDNRSAQPFLKPLGEWYVRPVEGTRLQDDACLVIDSAADGNPDGSDRFPRSTPASSQTARDVSAIVSMTASGPR